MKTNNILIQYSWLGQHYCKLSCKLFVTFHPFTSLQIKQEFSSIAASILILIPTSKGINPLYKSTHTLCFPVSTTDLRKINLTRSERKKFSVNDYYVFLPIVLVSVLSMEKRKDCETRSNREEKLSLFAWWRTEKQVWSNMYPAYC